MRIMNIVYADDDEEKSSLYPYDKQRDEFCLVQSGFLYSRVKNVYIIHTGQE